MLVRRDWRPRRDSIPPIIEGIWLITAVDGGSTATYDYDSLNHRVRIDPTRGSYEFVFDVSGQNMSTWAVSNKSLAISDIYDDSGREIAHRQAPNWGGETIFDHLNWVGTLRLRTDYAGKVNGTYTSLPWGDNLSPSGDNGDGYDFAELERDPETNTEHATYRQLSTAQGRWLSPDPYLGSYNFSNPQTLNRYAYALNNPVSLIDPSGLDDCQATEGGYEGDCQDNGDDGSSGGATASGDPYGSVEAHFGPCPDGTGSDCFTGDTDGEVNCSTNGGCLQWSSACQCWGAPTAPPDNTPAWNPFGFGYAPIPSLTTYLGGPQSGTPGTAPSNQHWYSKYTNISVLAPNHCLGTAARTMASDIAWGEAAGTAGGAIVGGLTAAGFTAATDTFPLAGATVPAGTIGGAGIGAAEATPLSTLGGLMHAAYTYATCHN